MNTETTSAAVTAEPPNSRQIFDLIIVARVVLGQEFFDKHWKVFVMGCWTGYYPGILLDMAEATLRGACMT